MKKLLVIAAFFLVWVTQAKSDAPKSGSEFVFARLQFNMDDRWIFETREAPWHHDYPFSEDLFLTMVSEVTGIRTTRESFQVVRLDSPDLFKYPWIYISEPGFMDLTSKEITNLRQYLDRGGFAICDDFRGRDLQVLRAEMKKVFPDRELSRLDVSHPVFHSFYELTSLEMEPPYYDLRFLGEGPQFWGMSDETGRLILVANQNNDLGEYMEYIDHGAKPLKGSALAIRLMINYLVYAMTH
jgi:hypothetical protein